MFVMFLVFILNFFVFVYYGFVPYFMFDALYSLLCMTGSFRINLFVVVYEVLVPYCIFDARYSLFYMKGSFRINLFVVLYDGFVPYCMFDALYSLFYMKGSLRIACSMHDIVSQRRWLIIKCSYIVFRLLLYSFVCFVFSLVRLFVLYIYRYVVQAKGSNS